MVYRKIYIPIWLDLLLYMSQGMPKEFTYLHSNMVRFIIGNILGTLWSIGKFTFQYG